MKLRPWWTISLLCCVTCSAALRSSSGDARRPFTELEDVPDLARARSISKAEFQASHTVALEKSLGYSPSSAARLELIQKSPYKMDDAELPMFEKSGFVVSERQPYSSFAFGYLALFKADLPVYVSADAILHAWHRSYDELLIEMEKQLIVPMLDEFLDRLRKHLASAGPSNPLRAELDEYLTVAHSLLKQQVLAPTAGGNPATIAGDVASATNTSGRIEIFGEGRQTDLSQFKPRGHYEKHVELQPYFRAMMWLGRIDFRFFQSNPDGSQCFNKKQVEAALWIRELMDARSLELYRAIDEIVEVFVGMGDSMMPADVPRFMKDLGIRGPNEVSRLNDSTIETAIRKGGYGRQRIQGDVMFSDGTKRVPMNASFTVFGQRYTIDSHVFHEITVDRGPLEMPDSFHTAFAVLGNDFALQLRAAQHTDLPELGELNRMRVFVEAQPDEYWSSSLYPAWLATLKTLSPNRKRDATLPRVTRTDAWQRRILATQLASWSELRHDTILYAKQSYTMSILCKFPDAYVDPYPDFYRRLKAANQLGAQVIDRIVSAIAPKPPFLDGARSHFNRAAEIMTQLEEIAEREVDGKPLTEAQLDWVNTMIRDHYQSSGHGCGGGTTTYDGWYKDLLYTADLADPEFSVADVHTDSNGQVLHVAKGPPLRFIVAVDGPSGPRAFVGATYSFNQFVKGSRMTDSEWRRQYNDTPTEPWLRPITAYPRAGSEIRETPSDIELEP